MKLGTKSLLFGVHQVLWHPWSVARAWRAHHGRWPTFYEAAAIVVHDLGYWGCSTMDGPDGKRHPEVGSRLVYRFIQFCEGLRGNRFWSKSVTATCFEHFILVLCHSRSMAEYVGLPPSALCAPDKNSILFDPLWFYWLRGTLSGEINEYRRNAIAGGHLPAETTNWQWLKWYRGRMESGLGLKERPTS